MRSWRKALGLAASTVGGVISVTGLFGWREESMALSLLGLVLSVGGLWLIVTARRMSR